MVLAVLDAGQLMPAGLTQLVTEVGTPLVTTNVEYKGVMGGLAIGTVITSHVPRKRSPESVLSDTAYFVVPAVTAVMGQAILTAPLVVAWDEWMYEI